MNGSVKYFSAKAILAGAALTFFALMAVAQSASPLNLPLYFEANNSQTEFLSSGGGYQFLISPSSVRIGLRDSSAKPARAQMRFVGANARAQIQGGGELPGKINYLIGNDSSKWQTGLPTFGNVQITQIYPGINLVFHGNQRQLEYDFTLAPDANPNVIKIHFDGVDKISLTPQGDLVLKIGTGEIRQPEPEIYQTFAGARKIISGGYKILDSQTVVFNVGDYNHSLPLVIDPVLGFSTFFGGNTSATGWAIAMDSNTNLYIAGQTFSKQFFTTNSYQTNFAGGTLLGDAFVAKFGNPATNLIYLTYLGGKADDAAFGLAVDTKGHAFITGYTDSTNFPTTNALYQKIPTRFNSAVGFYDGSAFVTELDTNGSQLVYSTYLGGTNQNVAYSIAIDSADNAYVTGYTASTNFPVTTLAMQKHLACSNNVDLNVNAFVTEIAANDTNLLYSTFLGGTNYDAGESICVDSGNYVYVAGNTASFNFPVWNTPTNLPYGRYLNGVTNQRPTHYTFDAFATKFPPLATQPSSVSNLVYSTFLGGTNDDMAYGIAFDAGGNAYVTGWTASTNFPHMNNPPGLYSYLITNGVAGPVATNAFLTKISADGSNVLDSAVFGGKRIDIGYKVAVDTAGDAFVVGWENSTNFPTMNTAESLSLTNFGTLNPTNSQGLSVTNSGGYDAFVTGFSANWSNIYYSADIGGKHDDFGYGITLDSSTNVYITGSTGSTNFPTIGTGRFWFNNTNLINGNTYINGAQFSGTNDAFLTEIGLGTLPVGPQITNAPQNVTNGIGTIITLTVNASGTPPLVYQWQFIGTNDIATNLVNKGNVSGATSNTLTIANAQLTNSGIYVVDITNNWGSATTNINLTVVTVPPQIITPPTNQTVGIGSTVTFAITASGSLPLFYQWETNGIKLANNAKFSGVTSNTLTIINAQTTNSGTYTIIVTNSYGSAVTDATLTVLSAPIVSLTAISNNILTNGLEFNAMGGRSDGFFNVLYTTNLLLPLTNWITSSTFQFDSQGRFSLSAGYSSSLPDEFFMIQQSNSPAF